MSEPIDVPAAMRTDPIVGDGAVEVSIAFAPTKMSVLEVEALRSGSVIELECALGDAELAVCAGGRLLASGRLVALAEGGVAVLLTRVRT